MKTSVSSFDLRVLVAEWQGLLGGHVDKIYQQEDEVIIRINVPERGKVELFSKAGRWLCIHEIENKPESPPPFAQTLRRLLDNARLVAIEQHGFDRIAVFRVERGPDRFEVIFEVFGKGNLILVRDGTIVAVLFPQKFKDRAIQVGETYVYPTAGIDPLELDRGNLARALKAAKGQLVRVLATAFNLGGTYAEELCLRADVDKETRIKDLQEGQIDSLYTALNNLAVAIDQERRPAVILQKGRAIDATPIELVQYHDMERRDFPTFNEALSHYMTVAEPEAEVADDAAAKFERRIAQQAESMQKLREEASLLEAQAVFLYGHYGVLDELIRAIREGRPPPEHGQIKAIDRKVHTITLAVGDFDAITLDYEKDVTANAQALYDRRKEALLKAQRVEEAIAKTRGEIEAAKATAVKASKKPRVKATKSLWFEAYRWTLSSDGFLILGGRDARTNDQLVKKHLREGDRYAHADIHGAPSTVIKDGAKAPESTLREACEFALVYSKAWSAGLASGSAYWVLPEQVSKQAESGEFLPRGAFIVRGKRNYFHDLPVSVAIGEVEIEGHRKIMGGPVSAVAARAARHVVLVPGKEDREEVAKRLATVFAVPIEEIVRAMPPGKVQIAERHGLDDEPRGQPPNPKSY
jgi:predicted ribosome quality control (RQC) complex YloA/Tae2 family protein